MNPLESIQKTVNDILRKWPDRPKNIIDIQYFGTFQDLLTNGYYEEIKSVVYIIFAESDSVQNGINNLLNYQKRIDKLDKTHPRYIEFRNKLKTKLPNLGKALKTRESNCILYIGKTIQILGRRLMRSIDRGLLYPLCWLEISAQFLHIFYITMPNDKLKNCESYLIGKFDPLLNNQNLPIKEDNIG